MSTADQTRRRQTDRAIADAQANVNTYVNKLKAIAQNPDAERITEITVTTVREILFTAIQHAPVTDTRHQQGDTSLRQAATIAALQARESIYPAVSCNMTAHRPNRSIMEGPEEWMHRLAPTLEAAGRTVRDVYRATLMGSTDALGRRNDTKAAREQAVALAAHISTVMDTATNIDAVRERMPALPDSPPTPWRP